MTATAEYLREYRRQIKAGERVPGKRVHPSPWFPPKYRRPRRSPHPVEGAAHGTRRGYVGAGCGCPECKGWSSADYQRRKGAQVPARVPVSNPSKCQVCGVSVLEHDLLRRCG